MRNLVHNVTDQLGEKWEGELEVNKLHRENVMLCEKGFEQQDRSEKEIETMGRDRLTELANMRAPVHDFINQLVTKLQLVTGDSISNSAEYNNTSSKKRKMNHR